MKRYLVFVGADYYPSGGWYDFWSSEDDPEDAYADLSSDGNIARLRYEDWAHCVDSVTSELVWKAENASDGRWQRT